jgi:hypothetical protein
MKIAVMQPYFLPYIGYFQMVNAVDTFVFYDNVNYIKNGWINRNKIQGETIFTIPLQNQSSNELIQNTKINWNPRQTKKFLKTIQQTYSKSPYFNEVFSLIEDLIIPQPYTISELAINSVIKFSKYMGINTTFKISSLENYLKGEDKVMSLVNICNKEGINYYLNPIGGQSLYDKSTFKLHNIKLNFIKTQPSLSIINECFNFSKKELQIKLNNYEII